MSRYILTLSLFGSASDLAGNRGIDCPIRQVEVSEQFYSTRVRIDLTLT